MELTGLDTVQNGLACDAEAFGGLDHRNVAWNFRIDKFGFELVGHANTPGSARGDLLPWDETVGEPAMDGGGIDVQDFRGFVNGDDLSRRRRGEGLGARDFPMLTKAGDLDNREPFVMGGEAALTIEDAGDDGVGVVDGQAA